MKKGKSISAAPSPPPASGEFKPYSVNFGAVASNQSLRIDNIVVDGFVKENSSVRFFIQSDGRRHEVEVTGTRFVFSPERQLIVDENERRRREFEANERAKAESGAPQGTPQAAAP